MRDAEAAVERGVRVEPVADDQQALVAVVVRAPERGLVIGLRIVGKLSRGKALAAALVPWAIYLGAKAGFVGLFN